MPPAQPGPGPPIARHIPSPASTGNRSGNLAPQPGTAIIHSFAASRNNDPDNGLALSKNAHWLFDNGLWSIESDYTVITADRHFAETGDAASLLTAMKGRQSRLPNKQVIPGDSIFNSCNFLLR